MKLAAAALAAAALVAPPSVATASQVVKDVKVVGSDAGGCKFLEEVAGCDANFVLIAKELADGTVKGQLRDVITARGSLSGNPDVKGAVLERGTAECISIYEDESRDLIVAVVAGTWDEDYPLAGHEAGDVWWTFAAIGGEGTPYYTSLFPSEIETEEISFGPYDPSQICDNAEEAAGILLENDFFLEHITGQVTIDKLACEDLRSEKKCGKFVRQCEWDEEEEACVELGACEVARTQPECRALGFECRWEEEKEVCVENLVGCPTSCSSNEDCCSGVCLSNGECLPDPLPSAAHKVEYAKAAKEPHSAGATAKVSMLTIVPATLLWLFN